VTWGSARLTCSLQDRPQRLLEEAGRHHRAGEAIRCEGHQREGEGHDGGLNGGRQSWGNFFLCFGASLAVLGKGLLFVCGFLAPTRASEYNCSLLRHGQKRAAAVASASGVVSAGVGREMFLGPSGGKVQRSHVRGWAPGGLRWLGMVGMGIRENILSVQVRARDTGIDTVARNSKAFRELQAVVPLCVTSVGWSDAGTWP